MNNVKRKRSRWTETTRTSSHSVVDHSSNVPTQQVISDETAVEELLSSAQANEERKEKQQPQRKVYNKDKQA